MDRREHIRRILEWLHRYENLADDAAAFREALDSPPPVDLLVPPGRGGAEVVAAGLGRRGFETTRFPWAPDHVRVHRAPSAGVLPEVVFGLAHPQGVASGVAARLLAGPTSGPVLDLCAAPGGKTLYLAALFGSGVRVVANEQSVGRSGLLVQTLARQAISSAIVVHHDGSSLPRSGPFERILVDAPCTSEGTFRVPVPSYIATGAAGVAATSGLQRKLLRRAATLLAPGGLLLYSVCSYAPEETEAVVHDTLAQSRELDVVEIPPDVPGVPGVVSWNGQRFDDRVRRARRLFPHHTGSWGFFIALFRKAPGASPGLDEDRTEADEGDDPEARELVTRFVGDRFGVPRAALDRFRSERHGRSVWLLARPDAPASDVPHRRFRVLAPGLRALRVQPREIHASNGLLRLLDASITRGVVDLGWDEAVELIREGSARTTGLPTGQVALRVDGRVVGAGFAQERTLHLQIPKAWRPARSV